jgi:hypothetical protein
VDDQLPTTKLDFLQKKIEKEKTLIRIRIWDLIFRKQTNKKPSLGHSLELVFDIAHSKSPQCA